MDLKKKSRREGGFTLIELISVIIILGILAAVITPKYFDMTTRAREGAANAAISEGLARFNMGYATFLLHNSAPPASMVALTTSGFVNSTMDLGDWAVGITGTGANMVMSAYDNTNGSIAEGGAVAGTAVTTRNFSWPQ